GVDGVLNAMMALYLTESAKYGSSAVNRFRTSDFIEATYAFTLVLANFGIAMAAKMQMITTTISSSMSIKPLRFICTSPCFRGRIAKSVTWSYGILHRTPRKQTLCPARRLVG